MAGDREVTMLSACETRAEDLLRGVVLIAVPHMDDAVLACGGTIAQLPDPERIHLVYATDGIRSPEPVVPGAAPATTESASPRASPVSEPVD